MGSNDPKRVINTMGATLYESDVIAWANEQAALLRSLIGMPPEKIREKLADIDLDHIAEEVEDVGKSEQRELASRMAVLLALLLKWEYQPERRGASWESTIRTQRIAIEKRLEKTPSLKSSVEDADWWVDAWADAIRIFTDETGIDMEFPDSCPWIFENIMDSGWKPSRTNADHRGIS